MTRLIQVTDDRNIDVLMGQEIKKPTRTQQFRNTLKYCQKHIVTVETKWFFTSERKQGGTFCITSSKMRYSIHRKIINYMGRWAEIVY